MPCDFLWLSATLAVSCVVIHMSVTNHAKMHFIQYLTKLTLFSFQKYITNPPFYYTCLHFLLLKLVRKCKRCYTIYCMEGKKRNKMCQLICKYFVISSATDSHLFSEGTSINHVTSKCFFTRVLHLDSNNFKHETLPSTNFFSHTQLYRIKYCGVAVILMCRLSVLKKRTFYFFYFMGKLIIIN